MTEACATEKKGTYLFCDTDSLAIVSSKNGGTLRIPGGEGLKILTWEETKEISYNAFLRWLQGYQAQDERP